MRSCCSQLQNNSPCTPVVDFDSATQYLFAFVNSAPDSARRTSIRDKELYGTDKGNVASVDPQILTKIGISLRAVVRLRPFPNGSSKLRGSLSWPILTCKPHPLI